LGAIWLTVRSPVYPGTVHCIGLPVVGISGLKTCPIRGIEDRQVFQIPRALGNYKGFKLKMTIYLVPKSHKWYNMDIWFWALFIELEELV